MKGNLRDAGGAGGGEEDSEFARRLGHSRRSGDRPKRQVFVKLGRDVPGINVRRIIGKASPRQDDFAAGFLARQKRRNDRRGAIGVERDTGATGITEGISGA